jgi:hypothetical protein
VASLGYIQLRNDDKSWEVWFPLAFDTSSEDGEIISEESVNC